MSPSATPATQSAAAPRSTSGTHARYQSQPSLISATPATQNEGWCEQAPRLPRKTKVEWQSCVWKSCVWKRVCDKVVSVCEQVVCDKFVCVKESVWQCCVWQSYVWASCVCDNVGCERECDKVVCDKVVCDKRRRRRRWRRRRIGIQNQKQEPHTQRCGEKNSFYLGGPHMASSGAAPSGPRTHFQLCKAIGRHCQGLWGEFRQQRP